jgi:hypothetical protein
VKTDTKSFPFITLKKKKKKKEKSIALDLSSKEFGLWAWKDDKRYKTEEHCPGHF